MKDKCLVWIIDDEDISTYILKNTIKLVVDCEVKTFRNAEEALQLLKMIHQGDNPLPGIILLDISMPGMNGWQFIESFNEQQFPANIKIHFITCSVDPSDKTKALKYPSISGFLVKPLLPNSLAQIIK